MKLLTLEPLVPNDEAVAFPHQQLQLVASCIDETEQCAGRRILADNVLGQYDQTVYLAPHVDRRSM